MKQNITNWADSIDWEAAGIILIDFAESMKGRRRWGGSEGRLSGGYEIEDVVQDVVTKYLVKYLNDPSHHIAQQDLITRLKKSIVNRLKGLSELSSNLLGVIGLEGNEDLFLDVELDASFDQEAFELHILQILEHEPILLELYSDLHDKGQTKEDIKLKMKISEQEYKNRVRRLRRRIDPILKQHNIIRQHARGSKKNDPSAERA